MDESQERDKEGMVVSGGTGRERGKKTERQREGGGGLNGMAEASSGCFQKVLLQGHTWSLQM